MIQAFKKTINLYSLKISDLIKTKKGHFSRFSFFIERKINSISHIYQIVILYLCEINNGNYFPANKY